ncbi:MAG: hypothetical protein KGJ49_04115 [Alphaproteobacteria bacterium]|nr:hypothetical protein [Alphaproteobacteria bacterium]
MRVLSAAALVGILAIPPVMAAPPLPPQHITGAINAFDPATQTLSVKTSAGTTVSVALVPNARVIANEKRTVADIKPGDFVASAALMGKDGKLHAQEVRIFPEALRGLGEGQYGMDAPNRSMTNATVVVVNGVATNAGTLRLSFHGSAKAADGTCTGHATGPGAGTCTGETEIEVAPGVPVTLWVLGDTSWLVPGMAVSIFASTGADGKLSARGVVVERNGVKPLL